MARVDGVAVEQDGWLPVTMSLMFVLVVNELGCIWREPVAVGRDCKNGFIFINC